MTRKRRQEEQQNHERWLVSYADFITLLFAFFVVMYSTSSVNEGKMRVLSDSLIASFTGRNKSLAPIQVGNLVRSPYVDDVSKVTSPTRFVIVAPPAAIGALNQDGKDDALERGEGYLGGIQTAAADHDHGGTGTEPEVGGAPGGKSGPGAAAVDESPFEPPEPGSLDGPSAPDAPMADVSSITETIRKSLAPLIALSEVALRRKQSWLEIQLDSSKLFVSGSARIATSAVDILGKVAAVLKQFPNPIQVEGFTDNVPISTLAYPSNWELSAARAASVVHLFTQEGIDPERMVAIGYGEHRPIADNSTEEGRAKNRRVVLVIPANAEIRRILDAGQSVEVKPGGDS